MYMYLWLKSSEADALWSHIRTPVTVQRLQPILEVLTLRCVRQHFLPQSIPLIHDSPTETGCTNSV